MPSYHTAAIMYLLGPLSLAAAAVLSVGFLGWFFINLISNVF